MRVSVSLDFTRVYISAFAKVIEKGLGYCNPTYKVLLLATRVV